MNKQTQLTIVSLIAGFFVIISLVLGYYILQSQDALKPNPISSCQYNGVMYDSSESFNAGDGCNTCTCSDGDVACTEIDCKAEGNDSYLVDNDENTLPPNETSEFFDDETECNDIQYESTILPEFTFSYNNCIWELTSDLSDNEELHVLSHIEKDTELTMNAVIPSAPSSVFGFSCEIESRADITDDISRILTSDNPDYQYLSVNENSAQASDGCLETSLILSELGYLTEGGVDRGYIEISGSADSEINMNEADEIISRMTF